MPAAPSSFAAPAAGSSFINPPQQQAAAAPMSMPANPVSAANQQNPTTQQAGHKLMADVLSGQPPAARAASAVKPSPFASLNPISASPRNTAPVASAAPSAGGRATGAAATAGRDYRAQGGMMDPSTNVMERQSLMEEVGGSSAVVGAAASGGGEMDVGAAFMLLINACKTSCARRAEAVQEVAETTIGPRAREWRETVEATAEERGWHTPVASMCHLSCAMVVIAIFMLVIMTSGLNCSECDCPSPGYHGPI